MTISPNHNNLRVPQSTPVNANETREFTDTEIYIIIRGVFNSIRTADTYYLCASRLLGACNFIDLVDTNTENEYQSRFSKPFLEIIQTTNFVWSKIYAPSLISSISRSYFLNPAKDRKINAYDKDDQVLATSDFPEPSFDVIYATLCWKYDEARATNTKISDESTIKATIKTLDFLIETFKPENNELFNGIEGVIDIEVEKLAQLIDELGIASNKEQLMKIFSNAAKLNNHSNLLSSSDQSHYINRSLLERVIEEDLALTFEQKMLQLSECLAEFDLTSLVRWIWSFYFPFQKEIPEYVREEAIPLLVSKSMGKIAWNEEVIDKSDANINRFIEVLIQLGCNIDGIAFLASKTQHMFSLFRNSTFDKLQTNVLNWAILSGHDDFAKHIYQYYNPSVSLKQTSEFTAIEVAILKQNKELLTWFIDSGVDVTKAHYYNGLPVRSPLHISIISKNWEMAQLILESGDQHTIYLVHADPGGQNIRSLLHILILWNKKDLLELALSKGADLEILFQYEREMNKKLLLTTVEYACGLNQEQIQNRDDIQINISNMKDHPLVYAARLGKWEIVDILLGYGIMEYMCKEDIKQYQAIDTRKN